MNGASPRSRPAGAGVTAGSASGRRGDGGEGGEAGVLPLLALPGNSPEESASRLAAIAQELSALLDASTRNLSMLLEPGAVPGPHALPPVDSAQQRLAHVRRAVDQMSTLVQSAIRIHRPRGAWGVGASREGGTSMFALGEAVEHAVALLDPLAREACAQVTTTVHPEVAGVNAGPAGSIVLHGLRNALESVRDAGASSGRVEVRVELERLDEVPHVSLKIIDNGVGLPLLPPVVGGGGGAGGRRGGPFEAGFTTKAGGLGLGLALCRELMVHRGGSISLAARADGPGAVLRARYPLEEAA